MRTSVRQLAVGAAAGMGVAMLVRRLSTRTGATAAEAAASLPGDEVIPHPMLEWTRAVTIYASPAQVWPWLAQMGSGRAGFYVPEWIDRYLWRIGGHNADQLLPHYQHVTVGDIIADAPGYAAYWQVKLVEPERALVYWSRRHPWRGQPLDPTDPTVLAHREAALLAGGTYLDFSWAFALREPVPGRTRLLLRTRARYALRWLATLPLGLVDVYLGMHVLHQIKRRVEGNPSPAASQRLPVHFFEEDPCPATLAKAAPIRFPATVFLSAPDYAGFQAARQELHRHNPNLRAGWAIALPRSLMLSVFADPDELAAVEHMLREVPERLPIIFDLEVPFWDRRRLAGPRTWPTTLRAIDSLMATAGRHHELWTAEWPPPGMDWPGWLRLRQPTAPNRSYMLYSTMMPRWWRRVLAWGLGHRFASEPGILALGTLAPGPCGHEPILSPKQLARDLDLAVAVGARAVALYRLAGLTPQHLSVIDHYAAHTTSADLAQAPAGEALGSRQDHGIG
jgi:hypothetical protein